MSREGQLGDSYIMLLFIYLFIMKVLAKIINKNLFLFNKVASFSLCFINKRDFG